MKKQTDAKRFIPVGPGILERKHVERIGDAIWLFLQLIDWTTAQAEKDGKSWGLVLGGRPLQYSAISTALGIPERTLKRHMGTLVKHGYVAVVRSQYGLRVCVHNSQKRFRIEFQKGQVKGIVAELLKKFSTGIQQNGR